MILLLTFLIAGCGWGPKEQEIVLPGHHGSSLAEDSGLYFDMHRIKVIDIQATDSYMYLNVSEEDREFWIAVRPSDYKVGSFYFYQEALLKTDFESKQLNRVFDSIYLVTKLVPEMHHLKSEHP